MVTGNNIDGIKRDLEKAIDRLERRILSLNYEGYFTRNLFRELKPVLELWVGFRVHLSSEESKIHCYGQLKALDDVETLQSNFEEELDNKNNRSCIIKKFEDSRDKDAFEEIWMPSTGVFCKQVSNEDGEPLILTTKIDVPLWVKKCKNKKCGAPYLLAPGTTQCAECRFNGFDFHLRGIIRLFSEKAQKEIEDVFTKEIVKRICKLFAIQEEPDCFRKSVSQSTERFCEHCKFRLHCNAGFSGTSGKNDLLDPDEVIHQLQDKCRMIMGGKYQFPILLYDSTNRVLRYRAVDYLKLPGDLSGLKQWILRQKNSICDDIEKFAKSFLSDDGKEEIQKECEIIFDIFESNSGNDNRNQLEKSAQKILKRVIQRTSTGKTNFVWNTWESFQMVLDDNKGSQSTETKEPGEQIREFAEKLLFTGRRDGIIMTPLGYLGQRLGIMFINVERRNEEELDEEFKNRLKSDSITFLRIAREFCPLLFHALEYEMYKNALGALDKGTIYNVPEILLSVFPKAIDCVAGAFWSESQIDLPDLLRSSLPNFPKHLYCFENTEETTHLSKIDQPKINTFWDDEFNDVTSDEIKAAWKGKQPYVVLPCKASGTKVYKEKDGINIRCRLLLPVRMDPLKTDSISKEVQGVFDLYFDISEFIINRHALDLACELSFLFAQIANAAKQKHKVLKHGIRAAIAAVMGRNMSHNIGSHVLSYLSDEELTPKKYRENESLQSKDYIYSLGFYKYLQGRSDFIAEISTAQPIWTSQMRLIKDVINPFVYSDSKTQKGELLNNLGRSVYDHPDNPLDASKIEIIIRLVSKKLDVEYRYVNQSYDIKYWIDDEKVLFNDLDNDHDPYIDIPHGLVGCHAFYSILENFLRNSFKHNSKKIIKKILNTDSKFEAHIEIDDNIKEHPDLIRVRLYDNVSNYNEDIAKTIREYIDGKKCPLVNKDGSLKTDGGWGIKEMRISSAWLRNISPEDIQYVNEDPALLSINQQKNKKLCYEFYLLKPLFLLLVDGQSSIEEIPSAGIYKARSKEEFIDLFQRGKLRHKFVIVNDKKTEDWIRNNKNKLPPRIFLVRNDSKNHGIFPILLKEQYEKLLTKIKNNEYGVLGKKLYEWWVKYLWGEEMPNIYCVRDTEIVHANIRNVNDTAQCTCGSIIFEHAANELGRIDALYWEPYSTSTGVNILGGKMKMIRDVRDDAIKLKTLYELYEVALANIVIADERIFAKLSKTTNIANMNINVKIYELLHRWNIDVINLKKEKMGCLTVQYINSSGITKSMKWSKYIENRKVTFLSIHQTIINEITEALFKEDIALSPEIQNVIIHSGRGPVDITPGFKFVGFSNIENAVIDKPDKHQLCSLLMNISSL